MSTIRRLWFGLGALLFVSFGVLLWMGGEIFRNAPPLPSAVVTESGQTVFTRNDIQTGREVWQSMGGQQLGSIWGHGALVAPDWSADWLHREARELLDLRARSKLGRPYADLTVAEQAALIADLRPAIRANGYDAENDRLVISDERAEAIRNVAKHYDSLFSDDPATHGLRETYAMRENTVPDRSHRAAMAAFFFWTSWAATTQRPDGA
jgi:nitric oxide reductase subunit B